MSLPDSSAQLAVSEEKKIDARDAGAAVVNLVQKNIKPRDIMTREAFENAITVVVAPGGSTNAAHLIAMAHAAEVSLSLDDFTEIGKKVPVLCDLNQVESTICLILYVSVVCSLFSKTLLEEGLLHGGCMTVTGKTLAENVADASPYAPYPNGQDLKVRPFNDPIKPDSHLRILYGNLATEGAVAKITGKEGLNFSGKAIVYESEEESLKGILNGEVEAGHVVIIRNEGPVGGPGMREMLSPTSAIMGKGLGKDVARSPTVGSPAAVMDS